MNMLTGIPILSVLSGLISFSLGVGVVGSVLISAIVAEFLLFIIIGLFD